MESWLFLGIILLVAILAKNQSLMIAAGFCFDYEAYLPSKVNLPLASRQRNQYWCDDHHSCYSNPYRNRRNRST